MWTNSIAVGDISKIICFTSAKCIFRDISLFLSYFRCIENWQINTRSSRINPPAQKRDFQGWFKKACGSLIHDIVDNNETLKEQFLYLKKKKKAKLDRYNELLSRGIIKDSTNYICKAFYSDSVTIPKQKNEGTPEEISYEIGNDQIMKDSPENI